MAKAALRYNGFMSNTHIDIESLDVEQRLRLIEELWQSLSSEPEFLPLSTEQRAELDRRLDQIDAGDSSGIPWDDVMARIRKELG